MNPVVLVCSRRASSRLPEKAFLDIAGRSSLRHILARVCGRGVKVVVAVPPEEEGDYLHEIHGTGAELFLGQADSPLHRMADYLLAHPEHDWVVRITHDDILIDWRTVAGMLDSTKTASPAIGYFRASGILEGAGVELIHVDNLIAAAAVQHEGTEFISYYVRGPGMPRPDTCDVDVRSEVNRPDYRLTMDYPADALLLRLVLGRLGMDASAAEVCAYLDAHPDLLRVNRLPLISFYTCARNAERWIGEAISSVLCAGLVDMEYVVVDDGSTDGTVDAVCRYMNDPRLRLVANEANLGLASSSNVAVKNCRGRYVMRIDADDRLAPTFLNGFARALAMAEDNGVDAVYPAFATIDEAGRILKPWNNPVQDSHMGGALVRKRLLDEIRFRDGLRHWDGLELKERILSRAARVAYINAVTWQYRQRADSMSRSEPVKRAELRESIMRGKP